MTTLSASFGRTVRRLRLAEGLTQEKFAESAGVSRNFQGSVERGESGLTLEAAERFAAALGISLSRLLAEVELEKSSPRSTLSKRRTRRSS